MPGTSRRDHTRTLTRLLTHSLTHSRTNSRTLSLTHTHSLSLTHTHTHTRTHARTHAHTITHKRALNSLTHLTNARCNLLVTGHQILTSRYSRQIQQRISDLCVVCCGLYEQIAWRQLWRKAYYNSENMCRKRGRRRRGANHVAGPRLVYKLVSQYVGLLLEMSSHHLPKFRPLV